MKQDIKHGICVAKEVLEKGWEAFDKETMASYHAEFRKETGPILIGVSAKQKGEGYGFVIMHEFLQKVGVNNTFLTTWRTSDGDKLFDKLIARGVLEYVKQSGTVVGKFVLAPVYPHKYRVIKDPMQNLREYAELPYKPVSDKPKIGTFIYDWN